MNVSSWSIRHPVPPVLLFVILTLLGIVSFQSLPITRFPNIDVPVVAITDSAKSPLAAAAEVWLEVAEADYGAFRSLAASFALAMTLAVATAEKRG